ncbi:MAG TPA: epoxide hydrolase [Polyangiaceae bacterium]|nr:epoxide hydrolase [Polyangiaceae bacterium]
MSQDLTQLDHEIEGLCLRVPELALDQLDLRLGRDRAGGEVWAASARYAVPPDMLSRLVDYWCDDFDFRALEARLNELPLFAGRFGSGRLLFSHVRSSQPAAIPLLLLHSGFGSIAELEALIGPLTEPVRYGGRPGSAFHVVCPALPGFGLSSAEANTSLESIATSCAELMCALGYRRYLAHGSDVGSAVARQLAARDSAHLAGAHVTSCPAFPEPDPLALAALTGPEKSQLALLTELEAASAWQLPDSPIELLALASTQLQDWLETEAWGSAVDQLLAGLTLSLLGGDADVQASLRRQARREGPRSTVPLGICTFPLDVPCLRRLAERRYHVTDWIEHERGGSMPALEQPELLLASLVGFCARFR